MIIKAAGILREVSAGGPRLSLCAMTAADPARVRAFLEAWRPLVDEVIVAVDGRAHPATTNECSRFADQVFVVPAVTSHMDRYLGWLHSCCSGDWILRADDDELPSEALTQILRPLLEEREPTHYWLPRRWTYPTPETYITEGIWLRDIQMRLVRNLPGLWRSSGQLHSNIEAEGAGRVVEAPLLHLALLVSDLVADGAREGSRTCSASTGRGSAPMLWRSLRISFWWRISPRHRSSTAPSTSFSRSRSPSTCPPRRRGTSSTT